MRRYSKQLIIEAKKNRLTTRLQTLTTVMAMQAWQHWGTTGQLTPSPSELCKYHKAKTMKQTIQPGYPSWMIAKTVLAVN